MTLSLNLTYSSLYIFIPSIKVFTLNLASSYSDYVAQKLIYKYILYILGLYANYKIVSGTQLILQLCQLYLNTITFNLAYSSHIYLHVIKILQH